MYINVLNLFARMGIGKVIFACQMMGLILLFGTFPAHAESFEKMISEQEAIQLGLERSEILQLENSREDLAESSIVEAQTWSNPEFSYEQENIDDGPEDITERTYKLSQEFSLSGQRMIKKEAAKQRRDAALWEVAQFRINRKTEIRQKFYEVLYLQQKMETYAQMRSAMDDLEAVMQERKKAGDISGYDLSRLQQERSLLMAEHGQALAEQQRLIFEFSSYLGMAEKTVSWPGVTGSLFPQTPLPALENMLAQAQNQPDLKAMGDYIKAFETDERHARRSWFPDLTLELGYKNTDEADADALLFGISVPIPVFDRNQAAQQSALANRNQLKSEYALALAEKKGTIRGLWHQDNELTEAVNLLDCEECLALLETAKTAYRAGEIGVLEILDAHRSAFEHQIQALALMKEARMVRIELEKNTGGIIQ